MNGKILISLSLVLAVQLASVHGDQVCKYFVSAEASYTCPDGSAGTSLAGDSKVCGRKDGAVGNDGEEKCFVGKSPNCPTAWPNLVEDKFCYSCCCNCADPAADYSDCCLVPQN